jgi:hypothetical protein
MVRRGRSVGIGAPSGTDETDGRSLSGRTGEAAAVAGELERIERALEDGDADLRRLGFWRVVDTIRANPALADAVADDVGRIDRRAFEARVRPLFPVWLGNASLAAVVAGGAGAIAVARAAEGEMVPGIALVAAAGAWSVGLHDLAHWAVGSAVGIRFVAYFIGGPPPPRPGLKTDYASYLRSAPARRAAMHASGAVATKLAPFAVLAMARFTRAPAWSRRSVAAIGVVQIVTDVLFSTRSSDWKRFRREMRAARAARA